MIGVRWVAIGGLLAGCVFTTKPMIPGAPSDMEGRGDGGMGASADAAARFDAPVVAPTDSGLTLDRAPPALDATVPAADAPVFVSDVAAGADAPTSFDAGVGDVGAPRDCGVDDGSDGGRCVEDAGDADTDASTDGGVTGT